MIGHMIMRSLLLILVFALVNSQARTFIERSDGLQANYEKHAMPPPPAPKTAPPTKEVSPLLLENYGRHGGNPSPPPPEPSTPVIQMITGSREVQNKFWTVIDYGNRLAPPPPITLLPPPHNQKSGGGRAAFEQSSPSLLISA